MFCFPFYQKCDHETDLKTKNHTLISWFGELYDNGTFSNGGGRGGCQKGFQKVLYLNNVDILCQI